MWLPIIDTLKMTKEESDEYEDMIDHKKTMNLKGDNK